MAPLAQLRQPRQASFTKSPIVFRLQTDYLSTSGSPGFYILELDDDPGTGETLIFTWNGGTFTYFFAPPGPGVDINSSTLPEGDHTSGEYYQELIYQMLLSPDITEDFNMFYDSGLHVIVILTKEFAPVNLVITGTVDYNFIALNNGTYPITRENYFIKGKLRVYADVFQDIDLGNYKPDINNESVEVNVSPFLHALMRTAPPEIGQTDPSDTGTLINLKYEVDLWDDYVGAPYARVAYKTGELYALKGGLSHEDFPDKNDLIPDWIDINGVQANFLTYRPEEREVTMDQEEFLYFFNPYNEPTVPPTPA